MAGIEDFVKLWRGNSKLRSGMNFGENRGRYWTNKPDLARYWAQGGSQQQGRLIGDILGKVKSLKIPKKIYERINPDDVWQTMIKDNNLLKKQKIDVLQTIMARAGSLSKLALKGLSVVASLPAQVVVMTLAPTRMGNAEATLEDFAKFADEAQPKEKEKMATGGNVPSTDIKDYYRRAWGLGDRVPFKYGGTWADWMSNFSDQMTFEEYLRMDLKDKKLHALDKKADGGRIGFADGPPTRWNKGIVLRKKSGLPITSMVLNPENIDITFEKPTITDRKKMKPATWEKILKYVKALETEIKKFENTKTIPTEKIEITVNRAKKLLKLPINTHDPIIKWAISLIDKKKYPHMVSSQAADTVGGLTDKQKNYYRKNYKSMGTSRMAQHFSKLHARNKKTLALKAAFNRFRDQLLMKKFIVPKDIYYEFKQPTTGYKIKEYNAWNAYEAQRNRLANLDTKTWNQEKYIGTKGKYKGQFAPYKLDGELLKFLNLNMLRGALHEKWPKHLLPSLEHSTGITAADIIGDSEGLRKVEANTRRWNFKETGAKSNLYKDVKSYLRTAKSAFAKGMIPEGNEALKTVNQLYDKLAERFNLNRKKFPFYKWQGGKIAEVNVKGVIKQGTVSEAFLEFFKNVVRDATPSELKKIKRIQPSVYEVLMEIKNGNTAKAKELIKVNAANKGFVSGKHTSKLFNFAGGIDSSMFPNIDISPKIMNALSKAGNVVKTIGVIAAPLNLIPYGQQVDRGM